MSLGYVLQKGKEKMIYDKQTAKQIEDLDDKIEELQNERSRIIIEFVRKHRNKK